MNKYDTSSIVRVRYLLMHYTLEELYLNDLEIAHNL